MVAAGEVTYPETVNELTQSLIYDWFQFRYVCDNERFNIYFNRSLNLAMRKYNQLLRIEPGQTYMDGDTEKVVTYDWLVERYHELQHTSQEIGETSEGSMGDNSVSRTGAGTGGKITTMSGVDVTDEESTKDRVSSSSSGSMSSDETSRGTQYEDDAHEGRDLAGTSSQSSTSDKEDNRVNQNLSKVSPQSISYSGTSGFPTGFDWEYPSTQMEDRVTDLSDSTDGTGVSTTDTGDIDTSRDGLSSESHISDGTTGSSSEAESRESGVRDVNLETSRLTDEVSDTSESSGEMGSSSDSKVGTSNRDTISREISLGRDTQIAEILQKAKDFILGTSAWDFLYNSISPCFLQVYDL